MAERVTRRQVCTIIGAKEGGSAWRPVLRERAFMAGKLAAEAGYVVLTGGHGGVMEYALQGAKSVPGALTIGILRTESMTDANPYCDIVLPTGIGVARNVLTALAGDVVIALRGSMGTLEELAFAVDFLRPVLAWGSWEGFKGVKFVADDADPSVVATWLQSYRRS